MIEDAPEPGIRLIASRGISYRAILVGRLEGSGRGLGGGPVSHSRAASASASANCHLVCCRHG